MQAVTCPSPTCRGSGTIRAQSGTACGQRVRKTQPEGGEIGLGMSPVSRIRLARRPGFGTGTAESSARV